MPRVTVADPMANARAIAELAREVDALGAELAVFPELSLTGYTCGDLFHNATLLDGCREAMKYLCEATRGLDVCLVAGVPRFAGCRLYNCAVAIHLIIMSSTSAACLSRRRPEAMRTRPYSRARPRGCSTSTA